MMIKIEKSTGNVYEDLGFDDAREMKLKAALAMTISDIIGERGMTQVQAAESMGMPQPKVSLMMRGIFRGISVEKMMDCLRCLGQDINISVTPAKIPNHPQITVNP